jgi:hypothetical protein
MKAAPAYAELGYVGLLSCAGIISRFGRQARLGERVDSGLTASRLSEFATLDKMRQKHKTRLGRFITSPRRLADLSLLRHNIMSMPHFLVTDPEKYAKTLRHSDIFRSYCLNDRK